MDVVTQQEFQKLVSGCILDFGAQFSVVKTGRSSKNR